MEGPLDAQAWDEIARDYLQHIVSPFDRGTSNPLFDELLAVESPGRKTVADLGCGVGPLLPFLCEQFGRVVAVDFSAEMLRRARRRASAGNVTFHPADLADLSRFRGAFDVAVAVNSILAPDAKQVNAILREVHATLEPGGAFLGIFPAMDSVLYHAMLVLEREHAEHESEPTAVRHARRVCEERKYDFLTGVFDDGGDRQKHYYEFELRHRLREAGFHGLRVRKVRYPWDESVSGFECFPGRPKLWDWLVVAHA
jgi:SAM-dependent methyltransferase